MIKHIFGVSLVSILAGKGSARRPQPVSRSTVWRPRRWRRDVRDDSAYTSNCWNGRLSLVVGNVDNRQVQARSFVQLING